LLVALATGARAQTCSLMQMASLDMTVLPNGTFAVPVSINGGQHLFRVDTSAIFTTLVDKAAQKLALKQYPVERLEMYDVGGRMHITYVDADSFKLGNNEAKHFHLMVSPVQQDMPPEVDGRLGPDMLSLFDVELDFAAKKMNLFSQDHCPGKVVYWTRGGYAELPFHQTGGPINVVQHIQFTMTLDGHDILTDLSTESDTTWLRHKAAWQFFDIDENSPGVERSPTLSEVGQIYRKRFELLQLGGVTVQNPMVDIVPDQAENSFKMTHSEKSRDDPVYGTLVRPESLSLGMNVIGKLHLYIAYKEHKIYVTAADAK
jgi:hypothetical protein